MLWVQGDMKAECAGALVKMIQSESLIEVYQIAFDINEIATQQFCMTIAGLIMDAGFGADDALVRISPRCSCQC